jgi:hypothetical protein
MKVLVQNGDTGLFLKADKLWTNEPVEARDFGSCTKAIDALLGMHLTNAAIFLSFDDAYLDMKLPLGDVRAPQPRRATAA